MSTNIQIVGDILTEVKRMAFRSEGDINYVAAIKEGVDKIAAEVEAKRLAKAGGISVASQSQRPQRGGRR